MSVYFDGFENTSVSTSQWFGTKRRYNLCSAKPPQVFFVVIGMNSNEQCRLSWNTIYGRIKAERLVVGKRKRGEELNEYFRFLIVFQCAKLHTNPKWHKQR
jgi:hypothetical protein